MANWRINIDNFLGGFAPAWYKETYPTYGNRNHAGDMQNADLTNPGIVTQGPGLSNLTNGTQAAAVTSLIDAIIDEAVTADKTYGVGGTEVYEISSSAVTNAGSFPHTITASSGTASATDCAVYNGNLYYAYDYTGAGDIGKYDLSSTFDDDWGSTTPTGAATLTDNVGHPMEVAGNDVLYIGNGQYVCSYDNTTLIPQALDLPANTEVVSLRWNADRLWVAANKPNLTGSNKNTASIYIWDGTTNSWEAELQVMGTVGGMHVKNGVLFVFYQDITSTGGYKLGYVTGSSITDLANFPGALPGHNQITDYKDFILWNSNGLLYAFGAGDKDLPVRFFQVADGGHATVGAVACPFGTPMVASWDDSTNYRLAQFSGYDTASNWKSLIFDVTADTGRSRINTVTFNFDSLASGAVCDWKLLDTQGRTIYSDTISQAKAAATTPLHTLTNATYELNGLIAENFRIELDWTNGSTTNPVSIRNIRVYGESSQ